MLRDAATAWLSRHHKVDSASKAHSMVDDGASRGYFRLDDGALYPVERANPACRCKAKTHEAVGAIPSRLADKSARSNPVKACPTPKVAKGKLTAASRAKLPSCAFADPKNDKYPIHDLGHARAAIPRLAAEFKKGNVISAQYKRFHKRIQDALKGFGVKVSGQHQAGEKKNPASNTQEKTPMAKAKKTPKAKKSPKKRRTPAQKAATKKMLAANKKARKPAKARTWKQAAKQARAKARKPAKRRATRRKPASGTTQIVTVAAPKTAAARRRAGKPRRKPAKARKTSAPRRKPAKARKTSAPRRKATRRAAPRTTRVVRTSTTTTSFRNPMGNGMIIKHLAVGMLGTAAGFGGAELIDRLIVTRAAQDKEGKATRITGYGAILVRSNVPDMYRFGAAAGGTLVLGAATWALGKYTKSHMSTALVGGLAFGFGLKFVSLGVQKLLPYIIPVKSISEDTWQNQLFAENFFKETEITANQMQGATFGGTRRFGQGSVGRSDFGPTAGQTGCGCGSNEAAQPAPCGCPKGRAPQADRMQPPAVDTQIEQPSGGYARPKGQGQPGPSGEYMRPEGQGPSGGYVRPEAQPGTVIPFPEPKMPGATIPFSPGRFVLPRAGLRRPGGLSLTQAFAPEKNK
jgi:hypothetical protein